jgi:hypothetical protein
MRRRESATEGSVSSVLKKFEKIQVWQSLIFVGGFGFSNAFDDGQETDNSSLKSRGLLR